MIVGTNCYSSGDFFEKYKLEDIEVGSYTQIGRDVKFFNQPDHKSIYNPSQVNNYPPQMIGGQPALKSSRGKLIIGSDVWVGDEAVLFGGVRIGNGVIVGAYSVVAKDIPPYAVVVGNPAKITRFRFSEDQIASLERIKWWEWDEKDIVKTSGIMENIDEFIKKYEVAR